MNTNGLLPPTPAAELAERLDGIFASIGRLLFARIHVFGDLAARLGNRFARARRRLVNLLALLAAGRLPRVYAPRPGRQNSRPPAPRFSRRRAWMAVTFGHHMAGYGAQLEYLLHTPETLAALAAAPPAPCARSAISSASPCRQSSSRLPNPRASSPPPRNPSAQNCRRSCRYTRKPARAPCRFWISPPTPASQKYDPPDRGISTTILFRFRNKNPRRSKPSVNPPPSYCPRDRAADIRGCNPPGRRVRASANAQ